MLNKPLLSIMVIIIIIIIITIIIIIIIIIIIYLLLLLLSLSIPDMTIKACRVVFQIIFPPPNHLESIGESEMTEVQLSYHRRP